MSEEKSEKSFPPKRNKVRIRYIQLLILFVCILVVCSTRNSSLVSLLAMTDNSTQAGNIETFEWDKFLQGIIISSSSWGELITTYFTGFFLSKYGAKNILKFSFFLIGIFSIAQPFFASYIGWKGLCFCKIMQGIFEGFVWPCVHSLLGRWAPLDERSRDANYVYSGIHIGNIITGPAAGIISTSKAGWPWVFYSVGILSFLTGIIVAIYLENSPAEHKTISEDEKKYIEDSLNQHEEPNGNHKKKVPWKPMLTSVPVWALIATQAGAYCGYTAIAMEMPTFFKSGLQIDLQNSGLLTSLPYAASFFIVIAASTVSDIIVNKSLLSLTVTRKVFNSLGTVLPSLFMILIIFIPNTNPTLAIAAVIAIFGTDSINATGFYINHIDLSPRHAGVILSVAKCVSNIFVLITPIVTGKILNDPTDLTQWRTIFIIGSSFYFVGNLVFVIWGTAEIQPWDNPNMTNEIESNTEVELKPLNVKETG